MKNGYMEREETWIGWNPSKKWSSDFKGPPWVWASQILLYTRDESVRVLSRAHDTYVGSWLATLCGGYSHSDNRCRGHLFLDWTLETGCPTLADRFPRRGYYHTRFDRPSLYPRDEVIGEETPSRQWWVGPYRLSYLICREWLGVKVCTRILGHTCYMP